MKVKTKVKTEVTVSLNGKDYDFNWYEEQKENLHNVCKYAIPDITKGTIPFTTMKSEQGTSIKFVIESEQDRSDLIEVLNKIIELTKP